MTGMFPSYLAPEIWWYGVQVLPRAVHLFVDDYVLSCLLLIYGAKSLQTPRFSLSVFLGGSSLLCVLEDVEKADNHATSGKIIKRLGAKLYNNV